MIDGSVSDGSTSYSTLRITGTGMNYYRELYTEKTGLSADEAPLLKGQEKRFDFEDEGAQS